jgi:AmmeMemoRadiSam system protein B
MIGLLMKEKDIGVVASSDFSHYIPANSAKKFDSEAIEKIKSLDTKGFFNTLKRNRATVCGYGPIAVAMAASRAIGLKKGELIKYMNSGDLTRDYSSVVAYAAIGFL